MSPMTEDERQRLREIEADMAGGAERCVSQMQRIEALETRIGKMEAWKDKVLLLGIGVLATGVLSLVVQLVTLLLKK